MGATRGRIGWSPSGHAGWAAKSCHAVVEVNDVVGEVELLRALGAEIVIAPVEIPRLTAHRVSPLAGQCRFIIAGLGKSRSAR